MFRVLLPQSLRLCFRQSSYVVRISVKLSHGYTLRMLGTYVSLKQEQCSSIKTIHDENDVFVCLPNSPGIWPTRPSLSLVNQTVFFLIMHAWIIHNMENAVWFTRLALPFFMEHKMGLKMGTQKSSPLLALVYSFSLAVAQPQSHTHTSPQNLTCSSQ